MGHYGRAGRKVAGKRGLKCAFIQWRLPESEGWSVPSMKVAGKRGLKCPFTQGRVTESAALSVPSFKEGCRNVRLGMSLHPRKGAGKRGLEWAFIQGRVLGKRLEVGFHPKKECRKARLGVCSTLWQTTGIKRRDTFHSAGFSAELGTLMFAFLVPHCGARPEELVS